MADESDNEPDYAPYHGRGTLDPLAMALLVHHRHLVSPELATRLLPVPRAIYRGLVEMYLAKIENSALRELNLPQKRRPLEQIVLEVCAKHGIPIHGMKARTRTADVVAARLEFYYRAAAETECSYPEIGRFIKRDHSTVYNGIAQHCTRMGVPHPRGQNPVHYIAQKARRRREAAARQVVRYG